MQNSGTREDYELHLNNLRILNPRAAEYVSEIAPDQWCRICTAFALAALWNNSSVVSENYASFPYTTYSTRPSSSRAMYLHVERNVSRGITRAVRQPWGNIRAVPVPSRS